MPKKRAKDYITAASRLYSDPASMMHGMVLASAQKPLASLLDDASHAQLHKGWEYGYLNGFANQTRSLNRLLWQVRRPSLSSSPSIRQRELLTESNFLEAHAYAVQNCACKGAHALCSE